MPYSVEDFENALRSDVLSSKDADADKIYRENARNPEFNTLKLLELAITYKAKKIASNIYIYRENAVKPEFNTLTLLNLAIEHDASGVAGKICDYPANKDKPEFNNVNLLRATLKHRFAGAAVAIYLRNKDEREFNSQDIYDLANDRRYPKIMDGVIEYRKNQLGAAAGRGGVGMSWQSSSSVAGRRTNPVEQLRFRPSSGSEVEIRYSNRLNVMTIGGEVPLPGGYITLEQFEGELEKYRNKNLKGSFYKGSGSGYDSNSGAAAAKQEEDSNNTQPDSGRVSPISFVQRTSSSRSLSPVDSELCNFVKSVTF